MADPNLSRQLASNVLEALKHAGHVLIAKGKSEALLRELGAEIEPTLARVIPRILRTEVTGEVTSTFGDEATDEAVEALVERLRQQIIDSEGIEDVFAEDKVMERIIFRTLHEGLVHSAHVAGEEEDDAPPISVRLDTLGYVASTASKLSDSETLKDALERAALSASTELDTFDPGSRTAFFASSDDDPDKRLEIEEAIEEELADLVEMGLVDLPTSVRVVALSRPVSDEERKSLRKPIHEISARVLTSRVCPGTWDWQGSESIRLTFTPMSEPDAKTVDGIVAQFNREVATLLGEGVDAQRAAGVSVDRQPQATGRLPEESRGADEPASKGAPASARGSTTAGGKAPAPPDSTTPKLKPMTAKTTAAKTTAAKTTAAKTTAAKTTAAKTTAAKTTAAKGTAAKTAAATTTAKTAAKKAATKPSPKPTTKKPTTATKKTAAKKTKA